MQCKSWWHKNFKLEQLEHFAPDHYDFSVGMPWRVLEPGLGLSPRLWSRLRTAGWHILTVVADPPEACGGSWCPGS